MGNWTIVFGVLGAILLSMCVSRALPIVAIGRTLDLLGGEGDAEVAIDVVRLLRAFLHAMKSSIHRVGLRVEGGRPVLDEGIGRRLDGGGLDGALSRGTECRHGHPLGIHIDPRCCLRRQ